MQNAIAEKLREIARNCEKLQNCGEIAGNCEKLRNREKLRTSTPLPLHCSTGVLHIVTMDTRTCARKRTHACVHTYTHVCTHARSRVGRDKQALTRHRVQRFSSGRPDNQNAGMTIGGWAPFCGWESMKFTSRSPRSVGCEEQRHTALPWRQH